MKKSILIIGFGPGLSMAIARRFGKSGYNVGMISRNAEKLEAFQNELAKDNIKAYYAAADAADTNATLHAIGDLKIILERIDVLVYNAVDYRYRYLMEESADDLTRGFRTSVGNAFAAAKMLMPELQRNAGSILLTGGGTSLYPNPALATISLGKAGIRNLAYQLNQVGKTVGVFAGTITITGAISADSPVHNPTNLAEKFWQLNEKRNQPEVTV